MKEYDVEVHYMQRDIYTIRADSKEDAKSRWSDGVLALSEGGPIEYMEVIEL